MGDWFDLKERIREANPIDQLIGETISVRQQGRRLVGTPWLRTDTPKIRTSSFHSNVTIPPYLIVASI
jgi:hypothetical protein